MKKGRSVFLSVFFVMALVLLQVGCGGNNSSGGGGSTSSTCGGVGSSGNQSTVDVAVGDALSDTDGVNSIFVFLDILAGLDTPDGVDHPTADIIVNNFAGAVGAPVSNPKAMFLTSDEGSGGDLYVSSNGNSEILIWRDYPTVTSGDDADVMVDNSGGTTAVSDPGDILVDSSDNLVIADDGNNVILIFNNASALTGDGTEVADVELTGNTCTNFDLCINNPNAIFVTSDEASDGSVGAALDLYVANGGANAGDPVVSIFRDINTLTTDQDPDAGLTEDVSFFGTSGCEARDVHVAHDVLFVATDCNEVFVFDGAAALATDALPDAILFGNDTFIQLPFALESVDVAGTNPLLLVGSAKSWSGGSDAQAPALSGFDSWFDENGSLDLVTGQSADVAVAYEPSYLDQVYTMNEEGGALFIVGTRDAENGFPRDLYVFRNVQGSGVCETMAPNIIVPGSGFSSNATDDFITDLGTFGSLNRYNAMGVALRDTTN